jgi:hypothetical protein
VRWRNFDRFVFVLFIIPWSVSPSNPDTDRAFKNLDFLTKSSVKILRVEKSHFEAKRCNEGKPDSERVEGSGLPSLWQIENGEEHKGTSGLFSDTTQKNKRPFKR